MILDTFTLWFLYVAVMWLKKRYDSMILSDTKDNTGAFDAFH